ncbi:hypothetical protein [Nonomuraea angiospora]|uniref:hypothetical protein n=1 Tax=Nonomuraea angiospora TaxID=46172 RepID=UPI0029A325A3|nr:hypothetical protein [Nonomuraea angiospora]MDX3111119.1 hypothetical protein [Nonomuraea angiospora]
MPRDQPDASQRVQDELAGGNGGPAGVQPVDLGRSAGGQCEADLAFDQAEDEQSQADDGDQRVDAAVVLRYRLVTASGFRCRICSGGSIRTLPALLYVLVHPDMDAARVGVTGLDLSPRLGHLFRSGWQIRHMQYFASVDEAMHAEQRVREDGLEILVSNNALQVSAVERAIEADAATS